MNPILFNAVSQAMYFTFKYYPPSLNWEDPHGYFSWYIGNGYMAVVLDDQNHIVGLCTARPVMTAGDGAVAYRHDPEGSCIWIDLLLVPKHYQTISNGLRLLLMDRFGHRETVAYFRKHETKLRVHDYDRFAKNLARVTREQKGSNVTTLCAYGS